MAVIAVGNQKGGVAKTTATVHLAAALGEIGRKVLVWDLDANAGATRSFGIPEGFLGTYEVMLGKEKAEDVILRNDPSEGVTLPLNVDFICARRNLETIDIELQKVSKFVDARQALRKPLESLEGKYDYILLDTAPNTNAPTTAAYMASKWFLLAAMPDPLAIQGLNDALQDIQDVREYGDTNLELLGVVLSCVDSRTILASKLMRCVKESFPENAGAFEAKISRAVAVPRAQGLGLTLFQTESNHKVAEQYRRLARELEKRIFIRENGA